MQLTLSCEGKINAAELEQASLLISDTPCELNLGNIIVKLDVTDNITIPVTLNKTFELTLNMSELESIKEEIPILPNHLSTQELHNLDQDLDAVQRRLESVKHEMRTHRWTTTAWKVLSYLGYTCITIVTIWLQNKLGILDLIKKCMPNICVNIFSHNRQTTRNYGGPPHHVVQYQRNEFPSDLPPAYFQEAPVDDEDSPFRLQGNTKRRYDARGPASIYEGGCNPKVNRPHPVI